MTADPKPPRRIVDKKAQPFDRSPIDAGVCPLCFGPMVQFSRAHVVPKGRGGGGDDVPENLAFICGDGVMGCHGCLTHRNRVIGHRLAPDEVSTAFVLYCRVTVPLLGAYADAKRYPGWLEDYYLGGALEAHEQEGIAA